MHLSTPASEAEAAEAFRNISRDAIGDMMQREMLLPVQDSKPVEGSPVPSNRAGTKGTETSAQSIASSGRDLMVADSVAKQALQQIVEGNIGVGVPSQNGSTPHASSNCEPSDAAASAAKDTVNSLRLALFGNNP